MFYIRKSGELEWVSPSNDGRNLETAWLEIPSDGSRARWLRKDGSLIRLWSNPSVGPRVSYYKPVSRPGAFVMYAEYLLVDEGL